MLVVEHRHNAAAGFEDLHGALKERVAWIEGLAFFRARVKAVLGDNDHTINLKLRAPKRESFFDGRINLHSVPARAVAAEVAFRKLVHIERGQFDRRTMMPALPAVAFEKTVDEMFGVRIFTDFSGKKSDPLATS